MPNQRFVLLQLHLITTSTFTTLSAVLDFSKLLLALFHPTTKKKAHGLLLTALVCTNKEAEKKSDKDINNTKGKAIADVTKAVNMFAQLAQQAAFSSARKEEVQILVIFTTQGHPCDYIQYNEQCIRTNNPVATMMHLCKQHTQRRTHGHFFPHEVSWKCHDDKQHLNAVLWQYIIAATDYYLRFGSRWRYHHLLCGCAQ